RAHALAAEAVAIAENGATDALAFCLFAQHDLEWGPGTARRRLDLADRMVAAADDEPELRFEGLLCRFVALVELADPAAGSALRAAGASAQRLGQPHLRYLALSRRAAFSLATGDLEAGLRLVDEAHELADTLGEPDGWGVYATAKLMTGQLRGGAIGL